MLSQAGIIAKGWFPLTLSGSRLSYLFAYRDFSRGSFTIRHWSFSSFVRFPNDIGFTVRVVRVDMLSRMP